VLSRALQLLLVSVLAALALVSSRSRISSIGCWKFAANHERPAYQAESVATYGAKIRDCLKGDALPETRLERYITGQLVCCGTSSPVHFLTFHFALSTNHVLFKSKGPKRSLVQWSSLLICFGRSSAK
jgi:hypothetical protein